VVESAIPAAVDPFRNGSFQKLTETVHGTLLTRGKAEMLWHALNSGNTSSIAPEHRTLSSASAVSECFGHKLMFSVAYGRDKILRESIRVVEGLTEDFDPKGCRVVGTTMFPSTGSTFTPLMLENLKKSLKDADETGSGIDMIVKLV
jgi:hypothetical protein